MAKSSMQKIFNNSLLYAIGTIASKAVGFFLVPIYTYNMTGEEYGIATTITSFVGTFGIVIMMSLRAAMIRFYNEYNQQDKKRFVGTIATFVMVNAVVICTLLCILNKLYMPFLFEGVSFYPLVFWGVLSLGMEGVYLVYQALLQARQDGRNYSLNSIIYLFFHGATVVVFVAIMKLGAFGMIMSHFVTNSCFAIYGIISMSMNKYMTLSLDLSILSKSLKYSLPILPHNMANNLNFYAIKVIINKTLSYVMTGLYTLASQFSTIINLVQSSVNLAFRPWFVEQMQRGEEGRREIKQMSCMIMALYSFCAVGISLFCREIVMIMSEKNYWQAWNMVPLFIITQLISFVYYSHVQTLMYNVKMSKFTAFCSFSGLIVNVVVSLALVKYMGIYGILAGQVISKIALSAIAVIMSNKAEAVDFGLKRMVFYIITASILSFVGVLVAWDDVKLFDFMSIAIKLILVVVAFFVYIIPYKDDYTELLKGLIRKKA